MTVTTPPHGREGGGRVSDEDMTCFFCGRGGVRAAVIDEVTDPGCDIANVPIYAVTCRYCGARGPMELSEGEAVEAWNRRAERTCHYVYDREICAWRCSECGGLEPVGDHVRYCPDCGARIEDEVGE